MFRTLIYPSSGACDCVDELPHRSSCSQFVVCWSFGAARFRWCSFCRLQDILMSETSWARKNWSKIASDIKLVFHSSTITMMHGPINIRLLTWFGFEPRTVHPLPLVFKTVRLCTRRHSRTTYVDSVCTQQCTWVSTTQNKPPNCGEPHKHATSVSIIAQSPSTAR